MTNNRLIYILGAGGHGKVVADVIARTELFEQIYFLDDRLPTHSFIGGHEIAGNCRDFGDYLLRADAFFIGIGNNEIRANFFDLLHSCGAQLPTVKCPTATVSSTAQCGMGVLLMSGSIVNADARIGVNVIINSGAIVEHDCTVGDHSHLAPACVLAGGVKIGSRTTIGAGAVVCPGVTVGNDILVGAGAVVTSDLNEPGVYVGVPARSRKC